jgi:hypothetical protein
MGFSVYQRYPYFSTYSFSKEANLTKISNKNTVVKAPINGNKYL